MPIPVLTGQFYIITARIFAGFPGPKQKERPGYETVIDYLT
jgi:hypothetical protein